MFKFRLRKENEGLKTLVKENQKINKELIEKLKLEKCKTKDLNEDIEMLSGHVNYYIKEVEAKNKRIKDFKYRLEIKESELEIEIKKGKSKDDEIRKLQNIIESDSDKEINRLEAISKRTKKARIRKKCKSRILDYKSRKLDLENERGNNEKRNI